VGKAEREQRLKSLEARARSSAAVGAIFVVLGGASFAGQIPWQLRVIAGAVAVAALIAAWLFNRDADSVRLDLAEEEAERERAELDRRVRVPVAAIGQIDATRIGVDAAAQTIVRGGALPEYVARDADEQLRTALAAALDGGERYVVVAVGSSKVGKSRTLLEALKWCGEDREVVLVAPRDGDALRSLLTPGQLPRLRGARAVLWLDDLEPFVNQRVTLHTLREWHATFPGSVVAATYGGKGSMLVPASSSGAVTTLADEILEQACEIAVAMTTHDELEQLHSTVSSAVAQGLERHGLAAYLVAAPKLERKLNTSRHAPGEPECPEGVAIVEAAVDWARCGRTDPITEEPLRRLWPSYLREGNGALDDAFAVALAWALRRVAGTVALLLRGDEGYEAFDYIVRLVRERPRAAPPRAACWSAAVQSATDAQALAVGIAAYRHSRSDDAIAAFARARESSLDEPASIAGVNLGVVLSELQRFEEALGVYDDVVARYGDAPDPALREQVAKALFNKGVRLGALERFEEELGVYDDVVARYGDAPDPALREQVAKALFNKGVRLGALERFEEALGVYDDVVARYGDAPDPALREQVAKALVNKGVRLGALERFEEELGVYDDVVARYGDAPDPALREPVAKALVNKGVRLGALERFEEALGVYDDVVARYGDAPAPALREVVTRALEARKATPPADGLDTK
jgi:tetratricopeptide (TPR) repeat protein